MKTLVSKPSDVLYREILELDLGPIRFKLMDPQDGEGWTKERTNVIDEEYRQFLFLTVTRSEPIVPTKYIDTFWHNHILDTMKYHADCEHLFGFYLHHFPYFGIRSDADACNLRSTFDATMEIWIEVFGRKPTSAISSICGGQACSSCVEISEAGRKPGDQFSVSWRPSA